MEQLSQPRILIVDDSRATRAILRRVVEVATQAVTPEIRLADSAVEALQMVDDFAPDLILTDWHMPKVSGLELVQTLRQLGHHRVRIGLVTAEAHPERLAEASGSDVSFVLGKPFDDGALIDAVATALQAAAETARDPAPAAAETALPPARPVPGTPLRADPAAPEPPGPLRLEALRRLLAVAMKAVPHTVQTCEPRRFPHWSPFVLRAVFRQVGTEASLLGLLDFPALCLIGAGTDGVVPVANAHGLGRPDPALVQRTATVLTVAARLIEGHDSDHPWRLERAQIVARSLADPHDLLSRSVDRTDVVVRASPLEAGHLTFLRGPV